MTLVLAACTNTSAGPATDAAAPTDATPADAEAVVTVACTKTAADACAEPGPNSCTYPTFEDAKAGSCNGAKTTKVTGAPCGGYDVAKIQGVDTQTLYYYEHATGKLVAILGYSASFGGYTCAGGPASFTAPSCTPMLSVCNDAGADAATDASSDAETD